MRIAFDALPLVSDRMTGIGYCEAGQVRAMTMLHPEEQYTLQYFAKGDGATQQKRLQSYLQQRNVTVRQGKFSGYLYRMLSTVLPIPYHTFFGKDAEVTHFFNYIVPPGVSGKRIVTVHDMVYKTFPETTRGRTRRMLEMGLQSSMRRADLIVTDSTFSRSEIVRYFPTMEEKIRVVPCGVDRLRFSPMPAAAAPVIEKLKKRMGLQANYFLYLGTLEPRKNLDQLIRAYALLKQEHPDAPQLVLAGGYGWRNDRIYQLTEELHLQDDVLFTEYVPEEDVQPLICGAMAFVFPSLYEGFGMPPLEAMACGTPVLTTRAAALPEVVGDSAVIVDPHHTEDIAQGMERLFLDAALRDRLRKDGLRRAAMFSWENAAALLYNVYQEALTR
jgi:glycosyltransferase involved in cell wall biosynthesis